jgi:hypothetical protein
MERESTEHGPRLDEAMKEEIDDRFDPGLELDEVTEDLELPDTEPAGPGALSDDDIRRRSELATHLRPSIFPARRDALVACAREEGAEADLLDALEQLPDDVEFHTTEEVWEAFGRDHEVRIVEPPEPVAPAPAGAERFDFRFDRLHRLLGLPFGVTPGTTSVEIDRARGRFVARFGPWCVETPLSNVRDARISGGYFPLKTVGPAHLSLVDRGLTFATNDAEGVCLTFEEPVTGIDPAGFVRHPGLTVTVADPAGLAEALQSH